MKKNQILLAGVLTGVGVYAQAAPFPQFVLENNQLTISAGSGTTFTTQTPTISALGVVDKINDVPSTNGVGIPNFSFTILENEDVPDGSYDFAVGVVIDDKNSDRQMEAIIGTLTLDVSGSNITGTIPAQDLEIRGRDGSGSLTVTATVSNASPNGPVRINDGTVTFDAAELLTRLRNKFDSLTDIILDEFDQEATYEYSIVARQTSGPTIAFGTATMPTPGTFTEFPKVSPATDEFELGSPSTGSLDDGYIVKGEFNVVYIPPGGEPTPEEDLEIDAGIINDALDDIVIPSTGPIPDTVITQINTVIVDAGTLASGIATQLEAGTLSTESALTLLETVNASLAVAGTATQAGGELNTSALVDTISNVGDVLAALADESLSDSQKATAVDLAIDTLTSATALIGADADTDFIVSLITAGAEVLAQAAEIAGTIGLDIAEQVRMLATEAISAILPNLPDSITQGTDLTNLDEVRELLQTNPNALHSALTATPSIFAGGTVTFPFGTYTPGETVSFTLSGGTGAILAQENDNGAGLALYAATATSDGFVTSTDSVTGNLTIATPTERYVAATPTYRLVPDTIPDGISFLPDGTGVLVGNGIASELAPTAFDSAGFDNAVTSAGFDLTYRDNGTIGIDLGNGERFSGAFAYDNLIAATSCGAITIGAPVGEVTASDYAFTVTCANGPVQHVTPIADSEVFYTTIANAGLTTHTDRNTGIVNIESIGSFKPSFFVLPLTVNDQAYLNTNKNGEGVAFRATDANGDGKTDYEFLASTGVQVFYGL